MTSALEGIWRQVSATENGEAIDHDDEIILEIFGFTFTVRRNGLTEIEGVFEVDSNHDPQSIDWKDLMGVDSGKVFKAFCKTRQNEFEFCAADEGLPRPGSLEARPGYTTRRFERLMTAPQATQ